MPTVPLQQEKAIAWFERRVDQWQSAPASLGMSPDTAQAAADATAAARAAFDEALALELAYRSAVMRKNQAITTMRRAGGSAIQAVRAYADGVGGPGVYSAASVPPRAQPSPLPAPDVPQNLTTALQNDGTLRIAWQAHREGGVIYTLQRRIEDLHQVVSPWTTIGATGEKSFVDPALPLGTVTASYQIQAARGTKQSAWSEAVTVMFGPPRDHPSTLRYSEAA